MEKDEETRDNEMYKGAEAEERREGNASREERRTEERGRGGTWEEQEGPGHVCMCVRLALAGGEIAWVRLAGRVCLCLAEEGCETKKALLAKLRVGTQPSVRWTLAHKL